MIIIILNLYTTEIMRIKSSVWTFSILQ